MLDLDSSDDYTQALKILRDDEYNLLATSFPTGDDDTRRNEAWQFGVRLKRLIHAKSSMFTEITKMNTVDISKDLYAPQSQFRGLILELKKLVDQIQHCIDIEHPFESFSEDRCWLIPLSEESNQATLNIKTLKLTDSAGYKIQVSVLMLLEKLANAKDFDSMERLGETDDSGKVVAQRYKGKARADALYASHLCEPAHHELGDHARCYNPAHLVAETSSQNNRRKNCVGVVKLDDGTPEGKLLNMCPHGSFVKGQWINRCLGQRYPLGFDMALTAPQSAYHAPGESRRPPEKIKGKVKGEKKQPSPDPTNAPGAPPVSAALPASRDFF